MEITPRNYIESYVDYERFGGREPRAELVNQIFARFVRAERRQLTPDEFWRLIWLYSPENDVTVRLTGDGTRRLLRDVTASYEVQTAGGYTWPGNDGQIKPIHAALEAGGQVDPVYLRERYTNEPSEGSFYIEDGIHRLTALAVHAYRNRLDPAPEAYIGYFNVGTP